jgi:hypothetical protein
VGTVKLTDTCYNGHNYATVYQPAFYGEQPNDVPKKPATQIAAGNGWCAGRFDIWAYPVGVNPSGQINGPVAPFGGTVVTKVN